MISCFLMVLDHVKNKANLFVQSSMCCVLRKESQGLRSYKESLRTAKWNLKKQSQFMAGKTNTSSYIERSYGILTAV
jgi:hypothetical protein